MLMVTTNAITHKGPEAAVWLIDEMLAVTPMKPQTTYTQFINSLLFQVITPPLGLDPLTVAIINDVYLNTSTKAGTRENLLVFMRKCCRERSVRKF